jgi:hypothetical protein
MSENGIHNVYAVRLADGAVRRITDNGRENLSYSALQPTASGGLLYARHEYVEDVWMVNHNPPQ